MKHWHMSTIGDAMNNNPYICQLPQTQQDKIHMMLVELELDNDDIELAMNSRLFDLNDTIDLEVI